MANKTVVYTAKLKNDTKRGAKSVESSMSKMAKTIGPLVTAAFGVAAIKSATDAYIRQENAVAQLEQRLKSTAGVVGFTSKELQGMASSLQKVTTFGDEATIEMQSLLLTFTQIRGPIFQRAQESILNVAQAMGTDLKSAALQVGKALNDPKGQLSALSRSGIQFTDVQRDVIRSMQDAGDVAGAQTVILKELETQFGGAAEAARGTLGGAMTSLGNTIGDLGEKFIGASTEAIGLIEAINGVNSVLDDMNSAVDQSDLADIFIESAIKASTLLSTLMLIKEMTVGSEKTFSEAIAGGAETGPITRIKPIDVTAPDPFSTASDVPNGPFLSPEQEHDRVMAINDARFQAALLGSIQLNDMFLADAEGRAGAITRAADYEIAEAKRVADATAQLETFKHGQREAAVNGAIGLLNMLGSEHKAAAMAALLLEKGLAIGQTISAGAAAQLMAMAQLGPIAGPPVAAGIAAWTKVNIGLIAATGLAQAAGQLSGGSAQGSGTSSSPVVTQPTSQTQAPSQSTVAVIVQGNIVSEDDWVETRLIPAINAASSRNVNIAIGATA